MGRQPSPIDQNNRNTRETPVMFRTVMLAYVMLIIALAVASVVTLTAVAHDRPLHRAYACGFHKAAQQEWHLPATPCRTAP
jgi:hypothetical protein